MNKKLFGILIALMTLSLLGIISVQVYWISNAYQTKEEQFTVNVRQVLLSASKEIQVVETEHFYSIFNAHADSLDNPTNVNLSEHIYTMHNEENTERYIVQDGILEENDMLTSEVSHTTTDSIEFKKV